MRELYIITAVFLILVFGVGIPAIMEALGFFDYIKETKNEKLENPRKKRG